MKKLFFLISSLLISSQLYAASDSVAVFHRPEKVAVLVNERGPGRLQALMDNLGAGESLHVINNTDTVMITCGRNIEAASCTFSFLEGKDVLIESRKMSALARLEDLEIESSEAFETSFESSMEDKFAISVNEGVIHFSASKKIIGRKPAVVE